jgi:hypothetical protein
MLPWTSGCAACDDGLSDSVEETWMEADGEKMVLFPNGAEDFRPDVSSDE